MILHEISLYSCTILCQIKVKQYIFSECDLPLYQSTLESLLDETFRNWDSPENMEVLAKLIPMNFLQAAEMSVPSKSSKKPSFLINKSEEWRKTEIVTNQSLAKWNKAGKPRDENSTLQGGDGGLVTGTPQLGAVVQLALDK